MSQLEPINSRLAEALRAVLIKFGSTKVLVCRLDREKCSQPYKRHQEQVALQQNLLLNQ